MEVSKIPRCFPGVSRVDHLGKYMEYNSDLSPDGENAAAYRDAICIRRILCHPWNSSLWG
jgi:hypothetical protein